jgi:hypothetical protein
LYLWSIWGSLGGVLVPRAALYLGLDFNNSGAETSRDFGDVGSVADVTAFFEVLQVGAELVQEFAWGPGTHREMIVTHLWGVTRFRGELYLPSFRGIPAAVD